MAVDSCTSCSSSNNSTYAAQQWQRADQTQQTDLQQSRDQDRVRQQQVAFRPDPTRILDIQA